MLGEFRRFIYNQWQQPVKRMAFLVGLGLSLLIVSINGITLIPAIGVIASSLLLALPLSRILYPVIRAFALHFRQQMQQPWKRIAFSIVTAVISIIALAAHFNMLFHLGVACAVIVGAITCAALYPFRATIGNGLKLFFTHYMPKLKNNNPFLLVFGFSCIHLVLNGVGLLNSIGVLALGAFFTLVVYPIVKAGVEVAWRFSNEIFNRLRGRPIPVVRNHANITLAVVTPAVPQEPPTPVPTTPTPPTPTLTSAPMVAPIPPENLVPQATTLAITPLRSRQHPILIRENENTGTRSRQRPILIRENKSNGTPSRQRPILIRAQNQEESVVNTPRVLRPN